MDGLINVLRENAHLTLSSPDEIAEYAADIPLKSNAQIKAAAKIMEACTFYVLLKNAICSALEISKTKLYQSGDSYCG